jgi:hypothetical protein
VFRTLHAHSTHRMRPMPYFQKCDQCALTTNTESIEAPCAKEPTLARIAELEAALREVRAAIVTSATDTLWMNTKCPETIVDRIDAALAD